MVAPTGAPLRVSRVAPEEEWLRQRRRAVGRGFPFSAALHSCVPLSPSPAPSPPPPFPGRGPRLGEWAMAAPGSAKGGVPRSFVSPESRELLPRAK